MTRAQAAALATKLELDVDDLAICHACLSSVTFELHSGNERKVAGAITRVAPDLWAEGLALPVRLALERARSRWVAGADEALAEVARHGPRSRIVRAIVRRLAVEQAARARGDLTRMGWVLWPAPASRDV